MDANEYVTNLIGSLDQKAQLHELTPGPARIVHGAERYVASILEPKWQEHRIDRGAERYVNSLRPIVLGDSSQDDAHALASTHAATGQSASDVVAWSTATAHLSWALHADEPTAEFGEGQSPRPSSVGSNSDVVSCTGFVSDTEAFMDDALRSGLAMYQTDLCGTDRPESAESRTQSSVVTADGWVGGVLNRAYLDNSVSLGPAATESKERHDHTASSKGGAARASRARMVALEAIDEEDEQFKKDDTKRMTMSTRGMDRTRVYVADHEALRPDSDPLDQTVKPPGPEAVIANQKAQDDKARTQIKPKKEGKTIETQAGFDPDFYACWKPANKPNAQDAQQDAQSLSTTMNSTSSSFQSEHQSSWVQQEVLCSA